MAYSLGKSLPKIIKIG